MYKQLLRLNPSTTTTTYTMGSRQLGELLLRPASSLRVTAAPAWRRSSTTQQCLCLARRSFSGSPAPRDSTAGQKPQERREQEEESKPSTSTLDPGAETSNAIDGLFRSVGLGAQRTSSSATEFRQAAARRPFGSNFSKGTAGYKPRGLNFDDMTMPDAVPSSAPPPPVVAEKDIVYPRLNPSTGRVVELDPTRGRDIVRGLGMLGSLMARNKVKRDFNKQRFHERPGLKRKRLKSERWRARFKVEFDATCKRVSELTRKGW